MSTNNDLFFCCSAYKNIVQYYNYEENSTLKLSLVVNPEMLSDPHIIHHGIPMLNVPKSEQNSLSTLLEAKFMSEEDKAKLERERRKLTYQRNQETLSRDRTPDSAMHDFAEDTILHLNPFGTSAVNSSDMDMDAALREMHTKQLLLEHENLNLKQQLERTRLELQDTRAACEVLNLKEDEKNGIRLKELEMSARNMLQQIQDRKSVV